MATNSRPNIAIFPSEFNDKMHIAPVLFLHACCIQNNAVQLVVEGDLLAADDLALPQLEPRRSGRPAVRRAGCAGGDMVSNQAEHLTNLQPTTNCQNTCVLVPKYLL